MKKKTRNFLWTKMVSRSIIWCAVVTLSSPATPLLATSEELIELSIEELMNIEVTSVSGKSQSLSDSAAAIFVITNEDLKHSGVTNIPDALRMVPGLNVSRIDSNKWAVNSRAANSRFANKLLVLIDGRSVYTPTFSGVYWEVQDVLLEDVDRIEVIRGPGATLWGANAVNGVINIITKHTADTQGGFVEMGAGTEEQAFAGGRYGFSINDTTNGRVYAKGFQRDQFQFETGGDAGDDWDMIRGGFRLDSNITPENSFTLQGDTYQGDINQEITLESLVPLYFNQITDNVEVSGSNLIGRWHSILSTTSEFTIQAYYDRTKRQEAFVTEERDTFDLEFQHRWRNISNHDIIWGGRYHYSHDDFINSYSARMDPDSSGSEVFSSFVQDEITLVDEQLWFTLGTKLEHNDYSGYEIQPSARLLWIPKRNHRVWTAVSRAVRTPSRIESDGKIVTTVIPPSSFTMGLPVEVTFGTDGTFDSEILVAYELGYRFTTANNISLDITTFYNDYENLRTTTYPQTIFHGTYLEQLYYLTNNDSARAYGAEAAVAYKATDWLQLDLAYSFLNSNTDFQAEEPTHQLSLRSAFKIRDNLDLDIWLRYVDQARGLYAYSFDAYYEIDDYFTCDIRLAWRPTEKLEISLVGQNLLEESHMEFVQEKFTQPTEVVRGVYGKIAYRF